MSSTSNPRHTSPDPSHLARGVFHRWTFRRDQVRLVAHVAISTNLVGINVPKEVLPLAVPRGGGGFHTDCIVRWLGCPTYLKRTTAVLWQYANGIVHSSEQTNLSSFCTLFAFDFATTCISLNKPVTRSTLLIWFRPDLGFLLLRFRLVFSLSIYICF